MLTAGDPTDTRVMLKIQDDVIGGQEDKSITLRLELESPIAFGHLIDLNRRGNDLTDRLTIVIKDDDRKSDMCSAVLYVSSFMYRISFEGQN